MHLCMYACMYVCMCSCMSVIVYTYYSCVCFLITLFIIMYETSRTNTKLTYWGIHFAKGGGSNTVLAQQRPIYSKVMYFTTGSYFFVYDKGTNKHQRTGINGRPLPAHSWH